MMRNNDRTFMLLRVKSLLLFDNGHNFELRPTLKLRIGVHETFARCSLLIVDAVGFPSIDGSVRNSPLGVRYGLVKCASFANSVN